MDNNNNNNRDGLRGTVDIIHRNSIRNNSSSIIHSNNDERRDMGP